MTLLTSPIQDYLTAAPFDHMARRTHPGMAHFAGTGPAGATCRECVFFGASFNTAGRFNYSSKTGGKGGQIKPHPCEKFRQMMNGKVGNGVPEDASACKYFDRNANPPLRFSK